MRLAVVVAVLVIVGVAAYLYQRRLAGAQRPSSGEHLPAGLVDPAAHRTWVLVTAPLCGSCGPAEERLRRLDPEATLVTVDAAERPDLARELHVRTAPTLLLAAGDGRVVRRLAGTRAVNDHLASGLRV